MSGGRRRSRGDDPGGSSVRVPDMSSGRPDRLSDAELSSPLAPTFLSNRFRSGLGNAAETRINLDLSFFADRYHAQRPCRPTIKVDDGAAGMTVCFFDIRPALLETDARNSMEPFACWREAYASKYRNELRLYDLLEKEISRRLTPLPTHHGLDQATLDVFDTQFRDRQNKAIIDFGLTRGVVVGDLLRELGTDSSTAISSVRQLRKYLLDVGVTVPFIRYQVCDQGHMWRHGTTPPANMCCPTSEPFLYFSRILMIQCLFRCSSLCQLLHEELDRHQETLSRDANPATVRDWTDGEPSLVGMHRSYGNALPAESFLFRCRR
ncbi:hypothetical protein PBRA_009186 [Plasmodiophora brassicae]|uniref:Uncharacterized protein n=1 Tax=Plasmodiophora brassicae TaxID=37360 RepID=A0A0G4J5T0_PLABS|nr:hypothetical protein PBRA_009186 [Plasmodiophora brassicae]